MDGISLITAYASPRAKGCARVSSGHPHTFRFLIPTPWKSTTASKGFLRRIGGGPAEFQCQTQMRLRAAGTDILHQDRAAPLVSPGPQFPQQHDAVLQPLRQPPVDALRVWVQLRSPVAAAAWRASPPASAEDPKVRKEQVGQVVLNNSGMERECLCRKRSGTGLPATCRGRQAGRLKHGGHKRSPAKPT